MNVTERSIFEQFVYWRSAPSPDGPTDRDTLRVVVGCGTSYNLSLSIAASLTAQGLQAVAVPGSEWWHHPKAYAGTGRPVEVVALSRSGESTETVEAARRSRAAGIKVTALTCASGSALTRHADKVLYAPTHPDEGIVMTASASLMLLMGLRMAGIAVGAEVVAAAESLLARADREAAALLQGRSHFVFLGAGPLYGIAQEGGLKLQEMSLSFTQAYHSFEYRHGPMTLADERTLVVLLYSPDTHEEEAKLARQLTADGARVLGLGGPGSVELEVGGDVATRALVCLPALQILGERQAQLKSLDSRAPRHLTKVVLLG